MTSLRQRLTAAVLALSHAVIGMAGYALHELAPCADTNCSSAESAVCSCGHVHHEALDQQTGAPRPEGPFLTTADGHDASQCALCAMLAKFKVGYEGLAQTALVTSVVHRHLESRPLSTPVTLLQSPPARGPPVRLG